MTPKGAKNAKSAAKGTSRLTVTTQVVEVLVGPAKASAEMGPLVRVVSNTNIDGDRNVLLLTRREATDLIVALGIAIGKANDLLAEEA